LGIPSFRAPTFRPFVVLVTRLVADSQTLQRLDRVCRLGQELRKSAISLKISRNASRKINARFSPQHWLESRCDIFVLATDEMTTVRHMTMHMCLQVRDSKATEMAKNGVNSHKISIRPLDVA
jgi:hypothetical protein